MRKNMDELLKQALTPTEEPDFWLNQKILNQAKERSSMDRKKAGRRIPAAALAAAVIIGAGSVTSYAAWKYLAPEKVTERVQDDKLAAAFSGEDAVLINEQQTFGDYKAVLLGIVSGKDIADAEFTSNGSILQDRTYIVTAVERTDGVPMPETSDDAYADLSFLVSPLIKGYDPNRYNVITMRGGYSEFTEGGILYRLTECDNVEIFADQGLYLCVQEGTFYDAGAYDYDKESGVISRNEDFQGLNALFDLPIDQSKADPQAAAAYLTSLEDDSQEDSQEEENKSEQEIQAEEEVKAWMEKLTPENIDQYAEQVKSTRTVLKPDKDGYIRYEYEVDGRGGGSGNQLVSDIFPDGKTGMCREFSFSYGDEGLDDLVVQVFTLNEDGTVTFAVYIPKKS